jgi:serine/threonine-protein kinase RsbW
MIAGPSFVSARLEDLPTLMEFVDAECARAGIPPSAAFAIRLAAEEAFTNVVRHGYGRQPGPIRSALELDEAAITLLLVDRAPPFDPATAPRPELETGLEERQEGGLGVHLIRELMDEVRYEPSPEGNILRLVKHLGEEA